MFYIKIYRFVKFGYFAYLDIHYSFINYNFLKTKPIKLWEIKTILIKELAKYKKLSPSKLILLMLIMNLNYKESNLRKVLITLNIKSSIQHHSLIKPLGIQSFVIYKCLLFLINLNQL
jgi:hypothetical protein